MSPRAFTQEELLRIQAVKSFIVNGLKKQLTVQRLARQAAMSEERFGEGFRGLFGTGVGAYVHTMRMQTGKFLLRHTDQRVKEIATVCGYSKTRNFSSAYKKFFGLSPKEERRSSW